jgi:Ni,Fe-hydrogenase I small subunit
MSYSLQIEGTIKRREEGKWQQHLMGSQDWGDQWRTARTAGQHPNVIASGSCDASGGRLWNQEPENKNYI